MKIPNPSSNSQYLNESSLGERRRYLRHQRRWLMLKRTWQFLIVGSLSWGAGWLMTRPGWIIQSPASIQVEGTVFLSPDAVLSRLPMTYPQPLFKVPTSILEDHLESLEPIADATILRRLFPPSLTIHVQEYRPVAILLGNSYGNINSALYDVGTEDSLSPANRTEEATGFLDENGTWLPLGSYEDMEEGLGELPTLEVLGMRREYRTQWGKLYKQIRDSPVTVERIDWRQLDNLKLKTEIGMIHHGAYNAATFMKQIYLVDQLRDVGNQIDLDTVIYFDVRSPDTPFVQYKTQDTPVKLNP
ncbi:MAG: FtsQ-type POTRA domain-containing protein [Cyanobacteria bacterium P01_F01_bin.150]